MSKPIYDLRTYLLSKVRIDPDTDCWLWAGDLSTNGYGQVKPAGQKRRFVHRASYEVFVGPIPDGLVIDHLCRVTSCINPQHLEPVTSAENVRRGLRGALRVWPTHCKQGHEMSEGNYYVRKLRNGSEGRQCKVCHTKHVRDYLNRKARA